MRNICSARITKYPPIYCKICFDLKLFHHYVVLKYFAAVDCSTLKKNVQTFWGSKDLVNLKTFFEFNVMEIEIFAHFGLPLDANIIFFLL